VAPALPKSRMAPANPRLIELGVSHLIWTALFLAAPRLLLATIQITSTPFLPSGKVGQPYSFTFTGTGVTNGQWGIAAGSPPQGLT
jgi:hypothetical protein